jgi:16S rRNA (cytidine1402-2'-O)-methyltransferase
VTVLLYLIPTPIGNLSDMSLRAVETLKICDILLCEDTRRSSILLEHYEVEKKLESYHTFNETQKIPQVMSWLKEGKIVGLLSDGGCPALCDPGEGLIQACVKENIPFTAIPGPSAVIQALLLSGLPMTPFQFLGFAPKKESEFLSLLPQIVSYPGTTIFYESPHRITHTLTLLPSDMQVIVARELTKVFEEVVRGTAQDLIEKFTKTPPKGEIVLLIQGKGDLFSSYTPESLVQELQKTYKISLPEAIKSAAYLLHIAKSSIYKLFHVKK